jgi:hypothetical protein
LPACNHRLGLRKVQANFVQLITWNRNSKARIG